jgi:hypothetical protein
MKHRVQQTNERVSDLEESNSYQSVVFSGLKTVTRTDLQVKISFSISIVNDARTDRIASQGAKP